MGDILISIDVEEFDLPEEYGIHISEDDKLNIPHQGLQALNQLFSKHQIRATYYTTFYFARHFPELIKELSEQHEIASHGLNHSGFTESDLATSKKEIEKIILKTVFGFRMPRMQEVSTEEIKKAGYVYNSSLNPTWLPFRYNKITSPRLPFSEGGVFQLPCSVTSYRFPLFWLAFKNMPYSIFRRMALGVLRKEKYLHLYFHPWEFAAIKHFKVPAYVKKRDGQELLDLLERLITDLKPEGNFITGMEYVKQRHQEFDSQ